MATSSQISALRLVSQFSGVNEQGVSLKQTDIVGRVFSIWRAKFISAMSLCDLIPKKYLQNSPIGSDCPDSVIQQPLFNALVAVLADPAVLLAERFNNIHVAAGSDEGAAKSTSKGKGKKSSDESSSCEEGLPDGWGLWRELHQVYQGSECVRAGRLQDELLALDISQVADFETYGTTVTMVMSELERLGCALSDAIVIRQLIKGVAMKEEYSQFVAIVELSENVSVASFLSSLRRAYERAKENERAVMQSEDEREVRSVGTALAVTHVGRGRGRGFGRGRGRGGGKSGVVCYTCGGVGHFARVCPSNKNISDKTDEPGTVLTVKTTRSKTEKPGRFYAF